MLADRGVSALLDGSVAPWVAGADVLHVSGYSLASEPARSAALAAAALVRRQGGRVSLDLASVGAARRAGVAQFREACAALRADLVFTTEPERELVGDLDAPCWVVKRGAEGFAVERAEGCEHFDALPTEVVDGTGAGDALAAGYLVGGPSLAREAAARCVAAMGALPVAA